MFSLAPPLAFMPISLYYLLGWPDYTGRWQQGLPECLPESPFSLFQPCIRLTHQEMATVVGNLDLCTLLEQHDNI